MRLRRVMFAAACAMAAGLVPRTAAAQANPLGNNCQIERMRRDGADFVPIPGRPDAKRYTLTGGVIMTCDETTLFADTVTYDDDTRDITATGNVTFQQNDVRVTAERAEVNGTTKNGKFYKAVGAARLTEGKIEKSQFGGLEPDVYFEGDLIEKIGPKRYRITRGSFTTCVQPTRRWEFTGSQGTLELDKRVLLKNATLKVKDVPLFYVPMIYYPIDKSGRSTGFIMPQYGSSTITGTKLSNAFFWAINRSQDATFYHDWFTKTGQQYSGRYRYVLTPGSYGNVTFSTFRWKDQLNTDNTVRTPAHTSYTLDGGGNQGMPHYFRASGNVHYFTDVASNQLNQNINDFSQRQRSFTGNISGRVGRVNLSGTIRQSDVFYGPTAATREGRLPSVNVTMGDKPIGKSRIYYGAGTTLDGIVRQDDISKPDTEHSLWRSDSTASIRAPISSLSFLTGSAQASWRLTNWTESLDPTTHEQVPVMLTRQLFYFSGQMTGPIFARVFTPKENGYAERFKHQIEPKFSIERWTAFRDLSRVKVFDYGVDSIVGGTTRITYGLTNKLLVRRKGPPVAPGAPPIPGQTREILTVDLSQSYYSDALASLADTQYQSGGMPSLAPYPYSPLMLRVNGRPTDDITGGMTMEFDAKYRALRSINSSGTLHRARMDLQATYTKRFVIPDNPDFADPARAYNTLNATTIIHTKDNKYGGTYGLNLDIQHRTMLNQRVLAYYNSQCCGLNVDYQQIRTYFINGAVDRRFGVSFSLAGVGSFSNPLGSFGGGR